MRSKLTASAFNLNKVKAEIYRRSFYEFIKYFWNVIVHEDFIDSPHIPYICHRLELISDCVINGTAKPYDPIFNVPPGSSKSTLISQMFPMWLWTKAPHLRIILSSYAAHLSIKNARQARDLFLSEKFQALYPMKLRYDKSGVSNYENEFGGEIMTTSTGSGVTGNHANIILEDDPQNTKQALSVLERQTAIRHEATLETRTVNPGSTVHVLVQQRLHTDDVTGYRLANFADTTFHVCLPAILTDDVKPEEARKLYNKDGLLIPDRFDYKVLERKKIGLGSVGYAGQFLQTPMSDDAAFFKSINNRYFSIDNGCIVTEKNERIFIDTCVRFFTIDLAITTNANSDYTVISYFAADKNNNLYLIDCYREKIEGAGHADLIDMMYKKYKPHAVGVESVAYQQSLCQTLIRMGLPVVMLRPDKSKETRAWSAAIRHENGTIYFNRHLSNLNDLESELGMFPNSKHDDFVDTLSYAVEYIQANDVNVYADIKIDTIKQAYKSRKPNNNLYF